MLYTMVVYTYVLWNVLDGFKQVTVDMVFFWVVSPKHLLGWDRYITWCFPCTNVVKTKLLVLCYQQWTLNGVTTEFGFADWSNLTVHVCLSFYKFQFRNFIFQVIWFFEHVIILSSWLKRCRRWLGWWDKR